MRDDVDDAVARGGQHVLVPVLDVEPTRRRDLRWTSEFSVLIDEHRLEGDQVQPVLVAVHEEVGFAAISAQLVALAQEEDVRSEKDRDSCMHCRAGASATTKLP